MRALRKELGISADDIAKALGVSRATIFRYEKGDIEKVPGSILKPLAKILQTTPAYLMGWEVSSDYASNVLPLPETKKVPLLGTIACGEPILAEENIGEYIDIDKDIDADFCLRCKGDSMIEARIYDGDLVYIRTQPSVEHGQIAAVLVDSEATLKRVFLYPDHITLKPENSAYEPLVYIGEQMNEVKILGLAVAFTSLVK